MNIYTIIISIIFGLGLPQIILSTEISLKNLNDWETMISPKTHTPTQYKVNNNQIIIDSQKSHSGLTWKPSINIHKTQTLSFSWKVSQIIPSANIAKKHLDDASIRILILFTEDTDRKSWVRQQIDKLFLLFYKKLPYDYSLAYVWANQAHDGPFVEGAYSHKLRTIVLDHGNQYVGQWRSHKINIYNDFKKIYGVVPPHTATLGVLSDTDTTQSHIQAWLKDISIK